MSKQGRKYDGGKLRYDLIPALALEDMVKGLTFGTIKYDDNNWVKVPNGRKRYLAASLRHIQEYRKGNLWDEEQNIHHLSAAMNNLSFIVEKDLQGWEDVSETPESVKAEKVIVMPLHYQNPDNDEDRKVRDFYVDRAKEAGVVVAFGSKGNILKESGSEERDDISQEELKEYVDSVVEVQKPIQCGCCDYGWLPWPRSDKHEGSPCHMCLNGEIHKSKEDKLQVDVNGKVTMDLWYPPIEGGENPWIEYDGSGQPVGNEVVVEILYRYEREEEDWYECCERAKCWPWVWGDVEVDQIVAYRVVD